LRRHPLGRAGFVPTVAYGGSGAVFAIAPSEVSTPGGARLGMLKGDQGQHADRHHRRGEQARSRGASRGCDRGRRRGIRHPGDSRDATEVRTAGSGTGWRTRRHRPGHESRALAPPDCRLAEVRARIRTGPQHARPVRTGDIG